jgi:general secretion pathway protein F
MPSFSYKSAGPGGKVVKGVREASDANALAKMLEAEGLVPLSIAESTGSKLKWFEGTASSTGVSRPELNLLISNLELLLGAGIDLNAALASLAKSAQKPKTKALLAQLRERVQKGQSLSEALGSGTGGSVPGFIVSSLRAGEQSGQLREVLAKLSDYLSRFEKFRSDLVSSLIYPAILLMMALSAIIILVTVVIPQFKPLFEDSGAELPLLTRIVVGTSDLFLGNTVLILAGAAALVLAGRYALRQSHLSLAFDKMKLGLPLGAGALLTRIEAARFTRLMALLLENGVPMLSALSLVREAAGNQFYAMTIDGVAARVREGTRFTAALSKTSLIPAAYQEVLEAGEEASQLETVLARVAGIAERETEVSLKNFMAAFVPLLTIVLGGIVAVIIMSVLFALLSINDLALR